MWISTLTPRSLNTPLNSLDFRLLFCELKVIPFPLRSERSRKIVGVSCQSLKEELMAPLAVIELCVTKGPAVFPKWSQELRSVSSLQHAWVCQRCQHSGLFDKFTCSNISWPRIKKKVRRENLFGKVRSGKIRSTGGWLCLRQENEEKEEEPSTQRGLMSHSPVRPCKTEPTREQNGWPAQPALPLWNPYAIILEIL